MATRTILFDFVLIRALLEWGRSNVVGPSDWPKPGLLKLFEDSIGSILFEFFLAKTAKHSSLP